MSAFVLDDGVVYHTFTSLPFGRLETGYTRMLERAPKEGEEGVPVRRNDEYDDAAERR